MPKRTINVKEILADIKAGMDDSALMEKYGISEKGLNKVFKKLTDAGVLKQRLQDMRRAILEIKGNPIEQLDEPEKQKSHNEPSASVAQQHDVTEGKDAQPQEKATATVEEHPSSKIEDSESPKPRVCPKCGKEYLDESKEFCPQDGFKLVKQGLGSTCPKCGSATEEKTEYCGKCGTRLFSDWDYSKQDAYYRVKFDQFERNGGSFKPTWNWAAFFCCALWYISKGMWGKSLLIFFVALVLVLITAGVAAPLLWVYSGLFGNYDYYLLKKKNTQWWE
ncbi:MAG: hypothetical protein ACLP5H_32945 [Desulfomonilaceae bacterium]